MAAPSYTEDLTDIDLAEATTGWSTVNFSGGGGAALDFGPDLAMQGVNSVLRQVSGHDRGGVFDNAAGISGAVASGVHIFQWLFIANPGLTDTRANTGVCVIAGSGTGALVRFHVEGNNTYGAAGRVGKCYAYRYDNTSNTSEPYRTLTGSPGATPSVFGGSCNISVTTKGLNLGLDAVRYGTGGYITAGDATTPATFDGFATVNDYNDATNGYNRWGIFSKIGGGYELQGTFAIGQNNAGNPTACYFDDSDRNIIIVDSIHAESGFTKILVDHASTVVNLTNINITAAGTNCRGSFSVENDSSAVTIVGGVWTDFGTTYLRSSCSVTGLTWRGCDIVYRAGGDIISCTFDQSTSSSSVQLLPTTAPTNVQFIESCHFISDGSNHAVDVGSVSSSTSISWKNTLSGYVTGTTGDPVTTGSTGNEAILCNVASGQKLTINVLSGASVPSVRNTGTGTVAVVSAGVTIDVNVKDQAGSNIETALVYIDDDLGAAGNITNTTTNASGNISQATYNGAETTATLRVRKYGYKPFVGTITLLSNSATNVILITDPQQT